jgi:hypothetical protein
MTLVLPMGLVFLTTPQELILAHVPLRSPKKLRKPSWIWQNSMV